MEHPLWRDVLKAKELVSVASLNKWTACGEYKKRKRDEAEAEEEYDNAETYAQEEAFAKCQEMSAKAKEAYKKYKTAFDEEERQIAIETQKRETWVSFILHNGINAVDAEYKLCNNCIWALPTYALFCKMCGHRCGSPVVDSDSDSDSEPNTTDAARTSAALTPLKLFLMQGELISYATVNRSELVTCHS